MTAPDPHVAHVVTAPHNLPYSGMWVVFCTCGAEFTGTSADEVREAAGPHRAAEAQRVGHRDRERDEERRTRREARRQQRRSKVEGGKR